IEEVELFERRKKGTADLQRQRPRIRVFRGSDGVSRSAGPAFAHDHHRRGRKFTFAFQTCGERGWKAFPQAYADRTGKAEHVPGRAYRGRERWLARVLHGQRVGGGHRGADRKTVAEG